MYSPWLIMGSINTSDSTNWTKSSEHLNSTLGEPRYVFAMFLVPVSLVGTFGNASVILVTLKIKSMRKLSNIIIAALAVVDLVICSYFLPVIIFELTHVLENPKLCFFTSFLSPILTVLSTQFQAILAYVRYKITTRCNKISHKFRRIVYCSLLACFIFNVSLYLSFVTPAGRTKYDATVGLCSRRRPVFKGQPLFFVTIFFGGVVTTFISYVKVLLHVVRFSFSSDLLQRRRARLTFLLFWLSVFWSTGYTFVIIIRYCDKHRNWPGIIYQIAYFNLWTNSCANPIVYNFMCKDFSEAFKVLFAQLWRQILRLYKIQPSSFIQQQQNVSSGRSSNGPTFDIVPSQSEALTGSTTSK